MKTNDVLRTIRYIFEINDPGMIKIFEHGGLKVNAEKISDWLISEDEPGYKTCSDDQLAMFLNGFIHEKRGKKEGAENPVLETHLTNNNIFMKLKIALNLKAEDVLAIFQLAGTQLGKHELSAFFRKPGHKHYRECKDQVLQDFLKGLHMKYRNSNKTEA